MRVEILDDRRDPRKQVVTAAEPLDKANKLYGVAEDLLLKYDEVTRLEGLSQSEKASRITDLLVSAGAKLAPDALKKKLSESYKASRPRRKT
ncbi:hypothetical protein [Deinococcus sp. UYEF24]